ncbi:MAG: hypothetical protein AABZ51_03110 [Nitrospirota bacterium]
MSEQKQHKAYHYRYKFRFPTGLEKNFEVVLNASTLELMTNRDALKPEWTKLKYHQCANCPLGDAVAHCPVAVNLSTLVETFKDAISFQDIHVRVMTERRDFEAKTTLQEGLSSIIGIYMVTSNCPIMDRLRPNVRFHLPFASEEETIYRAISMYLTGQYFRMRNGEEPDWELKKLAEVYRGVSEVNKGMSERLAAASTKDANVNAVIHLSTSSQTLDNFLDHCVKEIEYLFPPSPKAG